MRQSQTVILSLIFFLILKNGIAQDLEPIELTPEWLAKIERLAPRPSSAAKLSKKNILIFSLHTGYEHWVIPHTLAVMKILGEKSNAYTMHTSKDIASFEKKNLANYDALILNNTCSEWDSRNLFYDQLTLNTDLSTEQVTKKAHELENKLINYVKKGKGLMILHGGITMQNKSENFGEMIGGSFDYHPKQQEFTVHVVDATHPLVEGFQSKSFKDYDEPYIFKNAYFDYNFRPLLYMESNTIEGLNEEVNDNIKYLAWIKEYGKGRVFYAAPSHNAQSFENPQLLKFFVDGMQYVVGDLDCDDSPIGPKFIER